MDKYFTLHRCTFSVLSAAADRFVFSYIEYFSRKTECCITQAKLAEKLNISTAKVKKAIARLSDCDLVKVRANSAGQHKTLNTYAVNRQKFNKMKSAYNADYQEIRVSEEVFKVFGATKEAILYALMDTLTQASFKRGEDKEASINYLNQGYILYGQKQLADMCGCSARFVLDTLNQWQRDQLLDIEEIPMDWRSSKHASLLKSSIEEFAQVKKVSLQNVESEKSIPSNSNEGEKSIPSKPFEVKKVSPIELNTSELNTSFLNKDTVKGSESRSADPLSGVENSNSDFSQREAMRKRIENQKKEIECQKHRNAIIFGYEIKEDEHRDNRNTSDDELREIQRQRNKRIYTA